MSSNISKSHLDFHRKVEVIHLGTPPLFCTLLLTEVKSLNNRAVTLDINLLQVHEQLTTLTYEAQQRTLCAVVVTIALHVLGKVVDTVGE